MTPEPEQVGGTRAFLPAVEGMRACAAIGVVLTHVAFQTGTAGGVIGRLLHRFDLAVAVFFALSGFLLWRGHAAAALMHHGGWIALPQQGQKLAAQLLGRFEPAIGLHIEVER
jgi:peptidoglycan/LPS O-acetylase OafA/YrhL